MSNRHKRQDDHEGDDLDTNIVIAGDIGEYLAGLTVHSVLAAMNSGMVAMNSGLSALNSGGLLYFPTLTSDPAGASDGAAYYNSSTDKFRGLANGAWVDLN